MNSVSILIPCYNASQYVGAAVSSALEQTWRDLEVVVVDDGSSDRSLDILSAMKDPRLLIISQDNQGQCAAANRAFSAATGHLIKFFDADDILSPDHIELQVARLGNRRDAVVMGEWARFYGDDPTEAHFGHLPMYRDASPVEWLASEWVSARPMMQCGLWLIPRDLLSISGLWHEPLTLINDFEFFTRVLLSSREVMYSPGARLHYRSGLRGSLSARKTRSAVESAFLSITLGTQYLIAAEDTPRTRRACANMLQDFDYACFPDHADLRAKARARVAELGGADIEPDGPPGFHRLRKLTGWRMARRIQRAAEALKINAAARKQIPPQFR